MDEGDRMCPVCLNNYTKIGHRPWCDWKEKQKPQQGGKMTIKELTIKEIERARDNYKKRFGKELTYEELEDETTTSNI